MTHQRKKELYQKGILLFNQEKFYECHEALEEIWLSEKGPNRLFYQGLIQVASAFHHAQKKKLKPALTCLSKGIEKLSSYPDFFLGIDLKSLLDELKEWSDPLNQSLIHTKPFQISSFPQIFLS